MFLSCPIREPSLLYEIDRSLLRHLSRRVSSGSSSAMSTSSKTKTHPRCAAAGAVIFEVIRHELGPVPEGEGIPQEEACKQGRRSDSLVHACTRRGRNNQKNRMGGGEKVRDDARNIWRRTRRRDESLHHQWSNER